MSRARGVLVTIGLLALVMLAVTAHGAHAAAPARVVSLSRSVCFGLCPAYEITLYDDGTVQYEGKDYVKTVGRKTAAIDAAAIAKVKRAIADSGIRKLDAHCCDCQEWTDHPTAVIGFDAGGQWTTIVDYHGCTKTPRMVRELEETLDTLLGTESFIGTLEERTRQPRRR